MTNLQRLYLASLVACVMGILVGMYTGKMKQKHPILSKILLFLFMIGWAYVVVVMT